MQSNTPEVGCRVADGWMGGMPLRGDHERTDRVKDRSRARSSPPSQSDEKEEGKRQRKYATRTRRLKTIGQASQPAPKCSQPANALNQP